MLSRKLLFTIFPEPIYEYVLMNSIASALVDGEPSSDTTSELFLGP
jgi:hypothetical protein